MTNTAWPGDAGNVERWARSMLQPSDTDLKIRGLESIRIDVDLSDADLNTLTIDANDVQLEFIAGEMQRDYTPPAEHPEPVAIHTRTGIARTVRLLARNLQVDSVPMNIDVQLYDLPIAWHVYAEPEDAANPLSCFGIEVDGDGAGMRGAITASIRTADISTLLSAALRPVLAAEGVEVTKVTMDVHQDGRDGIRAIGELGARWRFLRGSARGAARLTFSPDGVVTVRGLRVGSRNPLIAFALLFARRSVRKQIGTSFDINTSFADENLTPRVSGVKVTAGKELRFEARIS